MAEFLKTWQDYQSIGERKEKEEEKLYRLWTIIYQTKHATPIIMSRRMKW